VVKDGALVGIVDMLDLIVSVMENITSEQADDVGRLLWDGIRFGDQKIGTLVGIAAVDRRPSRR